MLRQRQAGDSASAGLVCACCGKIHGRTSGGFFGQWHKCRKCRAIFCDWCGDCLWRPGWFVASGPAASRAAAAERSSCRERPSPAAVARFQHLLLICSVLQSKRGLLPRLRVQRSSCKIL
jgi:hypothetical protein